MLQYEKIDVSEGIDTNKTSVSKNVCFVITGKAYCANKTPVEVITLSVKISSYLWSYFLRWQFWNLYFEVAILKYTHDLKCVFWGSNYYSFLIHSCWLVWLCCFILSWLLSVNKRGFKCRISLTFRKNKGWITEIGWWKTN